MSGFKHLDLEPWPERICTPLIEEKLRAIPNVRDYQMVDLYLSDGCVLEEIVFIDFSLEDMRVEPYLKDVIGVTVSPAFAKKFEPPELPPLKWRR